MSELHTAETAAEQLGIPREAFYEDQSPDALIELRANLLLEAQRNLDAAYEITDVLVAFEIEAKSRKKRVRVVG